MTIIDQGRRTNSLHQLADRVAATAAVVKMGGQWANGQPGGRPFSYHSESIYLGAVMAAPAIDHDDSELAAHFASLADESVAFAEEVWPALAADWPSY